MKVENTNLAYFFAGFLLATLLLGMFLIGGITLGKRNNDTFNFQHNEIAKFRPLV